MEKLLSYAPHITTLIAVGGFIFIAWKYIDIRRKQEKAQNRDKYINIVDKLNDWQIISSEATMPANESNDLVFLSAEKASRDSEVSLD